MILICKVNFEKKILLATSNLFLNAISELPETSVQTGIFFQKRSRNYLFVLKNTHDFHAYSLWQIKLTSLTLTQINERFIVSKDSFIK